VRLTFTSWKGVTHFKIAEIGLDGIDLREGFAKPDGYQRQLDLRRALHTTRRRKGEVSFTREAIASHPAGVIAWRLSADQHSNIKLQMNYWLAETANLPEPAKPLFELLSAGVPVYREHTAAEYGEDTEGFFTRMSINPFGGSGWNWNIEGTAWLSQHFWEHYQFSLDQEFLKQTAWPWMRDVRLFWLGRLKELPDGQLVVPNAWSHEHGLYEDGTAHAHAADVGLVFKHPAGCRGAQA